MRTRVIALVATGAALISGAVLAESAEQLEQAVADKAYHCKYDQSAAGGTAGAEAVVRLGGDGSATISAPDAAQPQATGRWWADGDSTLCWDFGDGPACSLVDMPDARTITRMTSSGPVPCTAQ